MNRLLVLLMALCMSSHLSAGVLDSVVVNNISITYETSNIGNTSKRCKVFVHNNGATISDVKPTAQRLQETRMDCWVAINFPRGTDVAAKVGILRAVINHLGLQKRPAGFLLIGEGQGASVVLRTMNNLGGIKGVALVSPLVITLDENPFMRDRGSLNLCILFNRGDAQEDPTYLPRMRKEHRIGLQELILDRGTEILKRAPVLATEALNRCF